MATANSLETDTIAAVATPAGRGGIGIVRISGPAAYTIAERLTGKALTPRYAHYTNFKTHSKNGAHSSDSNLETETIDSGIALYFPSPHSFTGEDVVELQGHGGPIVMDMLLKVCCQLGARQARAGEFSERAFLNDKIDLTQAEAIADLINSTTESAARNANRSLQGNFAKEINTLLQQVIALRVFVEAAIDFPEEEIDFLEEGGVLNRLHAIIEQVATVEQAAQQGALLTEGIRLVIAGKPNAGKSSLLNALSGKDTAIVTPIAGTTRDVLREHIQIDGLPLHLIDTAGLRDNAEEIEQEGIRRARAEIDCAEHILLVIDSREGEDGSEIIDAAPGDTRIIQVYNKCDLSQLQTRIEGGIGNTRIYLSAKTGMGIDLLKQHLKQCVGYNDNDIGQFSARRRHLDALRLAKLSLATGQQQLQATGAGELLAEDLKQCQNHLNDIGGEFTNNNLLGEIFSNFCIGK